MRPAIVVVLCGCVLTGLLASGTTWAQDGRGSIVAWGYGAWGLSPPNTEFLAVAGGLSHSLGLDADGSIAAWGRNDDRQCYVPAPNTDFVAVAGGANHSLALYADGSIAAWGQNDYGQCDVPEPNRGFVAISGGADHSLGLKVYILGDLDGDGDVDLDDLADFLGAYGTCEGDEDYNPDADFGDSGCIDLADLAELLGHYGEGG
jgi:hypothetical protein